MGSSAQLAARDPECTRFEATVEAVDGRSVRLSETYFYAESGGQPPDTGTIGESVVEGVEVVDGDHVHHLREPPVFAVGDSVTCGIDETYRTYCMRAHTASHVLYGAGRQLLEDLGYGGFGIDDEKVRVDFTTSTEVNDEVLVELERLVNRAVWDSREVSWESIPVEEAYERDEVAFNAKTEEGVFGESEAVRVVTVEDWDWAACGGTHVSNTREIGPVTVLDRSNPGEGLTRVEFAVGPTGIGHRATEKNALLSASRVAGSGPEDLPGEVERLQSELDRLEDELSELRDRAIRASVDDLEATDRGGYDLAAGTVEDADANAVEDSLREAAGEVADVVVLVGTSGSTFVAAAADGDGVDAGEVVDEVTSEFGGGGGGSPRFAQGGGIGADPDAVVEFLRGE
jgi:alanyl-tRNA synthetase